MNIDLDKVPLTLDEALEMFFDALSESEKTDLKEVDENQLALFHHGIGQEIRNAWSLWEKNTPLVNGFEKLGITHADDMSSIIILTTHRNLNGKPTKIKQQIAYYQNYWFKKVGKKMP